MMQSLLLSGGGGLTLMEAITATGLTSGLQVCLDVGDFQSYAGGDTWLDRSGNNQTFVLGSSSGASASDPSLQGGPGAFNGYWNFSGAQYFTKTANPAWVETIHKNGASFTILRGYYKVSAGLISPLAGNDGITTGPNGFSFSNVLSVFASGVQKSFNVAMSAAASGQWHFWAVSVTEAAGSGFYYRNGDYVQQSGLDVWDATYPVLTTNNAAFTLQIGADGNNANVAGTGTRLMFEAYWTQPLSKTNLDSLFSLMRGRLGL